jgi:tRNA(Ile)-lysidine synthase
MNAARWRRLARLDGGRFSVGHGIDAERAENRLVLAPARPPEPARRADPSRLLLPGAVRWGDGRIVASVPADPAAAESVDLDRVVPWLDEAGRPFLVVRAAGAGDRFDPLGMGGKSMALNDFFRGRKVVRERRCGVPIVCDRAGIVWVAGHRITERVKQEEATARTLGLEWISPP